MFKPFTFNVSIYVAEFNFEFLLFIFVLFVSCLFHVFYIHLYFFSIWIIVLSVSSVTWLCPTLSNPMNCNMPRFLVHHQLLEPTQTHVHCVGDAIQPSHPLLSTSPPAFSLSQQQGLFQWVGSSHQMAKALEVLLQHKSFQWIFRTDFL